MQVFYHFLLTFGLDNGIIELNIKNVHKKKLCLGDVIMMISANIESLLTLISYKCDMFNSAHDNELECEVKQNESEWELAQDTFEHYDDELAAYTELLKKCFDIRLTTCEDNYGFITGIEITLPNKDKITHEIIIPQWIKNHNDKRIRKTQEKYFGEVFTNENLY